MTGFAARGLGKSRMARGVELKRGSGKEFEREKGGGGREIHSPSVVKQITVYVT